MPPGREPGDPKPPKVKRPRQSPNPSDRASPNQARNDPQTGEPSRTQIRGSSQSTQRSRQSEAASESRGSPLPIELGTKLSVTDRSERPPVPRFHAASAPDRLPPDPGPVRPTTTQRPSSLRDPLPGETVPDPAPLGSVNIPQPSQQPPPADNAELFNRRSPAPTKQKKSARKSGPKKPKKKPGPKKSTAAPSGVKKAPRLMEPRQRPQLYLSTVRSTRSHGSRGLVGKDELDKVNAASRKAASRGARG